MSEKEAKRQESVEEALLRELRFGGLDKENLKELVGIIAGIHKGGLKKFKVFPKGIINPDGIRITGLIDAGEINQFLSQILLKTPRLGRTTFFPYGIINPDSFRVNIDIGAAHDIDSFNR